MSQTGWGHTVGMPAEILRLIGWWEYIETASRPYPAHLLDTAENRESNRKRDEMDERKETDGKA